MDLGFVKQCSLALALVEKMLRTEAAEHCEMIFFFALSENGGDRISEIFLCSTHGEGTAARRINDLCVI